MAATPVGTVSSGERISRYAARLHGGASDSRFDDPIALFKKKCPKSGLSAAGSLTALMRAVIFVLFSVTFYASISSAFYITNTSFRRRVNIFFYI